MKRFKKVMCVVCVILLCACADKKPKHSHDSSYTCPMHPQIVQEKPGSCPICKMDLVKVTSGTAKESLMLSTTQMRLANIKTQVITAKNFSSSRILNGRLLVNPGTTELVAAKYPGRVEKLFIKETGEKVRVGQPLLQLYSEEIQSLQEEFLLQQKQAAAFPEETIYQKLKKAVHNKLLLYGFSVRDINELSSRRRASPLVIVRSPVSGIVDEILLTEGQYISEGTAIMQRSRYDKLWIEADIYPSELADISIGAVFEVSVSGALHHHNSRIEFINPQLNPSSQTLTLRGTIDNSAGNLHPGMAAQVILPVLSKTNVLSLPLDALIRDEKGAHVWIKTGENVFVPRSVNVGAENAQTIVVSSGIKSGEEVVTAGVYLLYSEYVLKKGTGPSSANQH